jgi:subtilisin family serine protease
MRRAPRRQAPLLFVIVVVCVQLGAPPQPSAAPQNRSQDGDRGRKKYVEGQLLVRFRTAEKGAQAATHQQFRAIAKREFPLVPNLQLVELPEEWTVEKAAAAYQQNPAVLYAEPNYIYHTLQNPVTPNDPRFPELWGLHNTGQLGGTPDADIDAPEAWGITTGSPSVVVGVIDTGIDYNHPDLAANMFRNTADCNSNGVDDDGNGFIDDCYGINPAYGTSDPMDDHSHGTHVAGTIGAAGNNGVGVVGVNWNVRLMACKFLDADGFGSTSGAVACLQYFATMYDRGVNLVATNNSWGGGGFSFALRDAIDQHRQRGILFVAAAGNSTRDNDLSVSYPANYYLPNVISVAATTRNDGLASFSNFGRRTVHLGAPGAEILSTVPGGGYATFSGTSMASPHVTGVAALLKAQDPGRDWKTIKNLLLTGGDPVPAGTNINFLTRRRLNARGSMTCANQVILAPLLPLAGAPGTTAVVGIPVDLAMLHINCGLPNGDLQVLVNGGPQNITLLDDGSGADQEAGDGIYSGQWIPATSGAQTLQLPDGTNIAIQVLSPYVHSPVAFNYRNITGQRLDLADDGVAFQSTPFAIPFGGGSFTGWFIGDNGNVLFVGTLPSSTNSPLPIPQGGTLVAPFWDDLIADNGAIFYEVLGAPGSRELVVEWRNYGNWNCNFGDAITFQVVFFENSSDILFNYLDTDFTTCDARAGASATVGVQVAAGVASQFSFNAPVVHSLTSILWQLGSPTPSITSLSPFDAVAGDPGFTLRVKGKNFLSNSVLRWNGADRPTSFVNSSELAAVISTSDVAAAGTAQVTVFNPPPSGGGESAPVAFDILAMRPMPVLTSVTPDTIVLGSFGATLTATGMGFSSASVLRWNGVDQATTVTNSTLLRAEILPGSLAALGTAQVTVFNPPPGGGQSNALPVEVSNPTPELWFSSPERATAGGPEFKLQLTGEGFIQTSVARWNGSDRPTTFVSFFRLEATIAAADIATPGTAQVTVINPAPGGGTSNPLPFNIVPPAPNDHFANSTRIAAVPFTDAVATQAATVEPGDPRPPCGSGSRENSVWYTFIVPAGATINVNAFSSDYDTVLSAWTGGPGSFVSVACLGLQSSLRITRATQTTLHFMVTDYSSGGGLLVFNLDIEPSFTMSSSAGSATVQRGQAATFTLTVGPQFGTLSAPITFTCPNPPVGVTCTFAPTQIVLGAGPATTTLTISTSGLASLAPRHEMQPVFALWLALPVVGLLAAPFARRHSRKHWLGLGLLLLAVFLIAGGQVSCGGGGGGGGGGGQGPPQTQQVIVTVRASSGAATQQMGITLTVVR